MKTFRVRQIYKIIHLAMILLLLGLMFFLAFLFTSLGSSLGKALERTTSILWVPAFGCSIPFLLLAGWFGVYLAAFQKMRLTFNSEKVTLESIKRFRFLLPAGYKPFEISYDQIKKVKFEGLINRVLLTDQKGKQVNLFPMLFSKNHGEAVLTELRSHLPMESFEPGMETPVVLGTWSRQNRIRILFVVFILALYFASMFFDPDVSSRAWLTNDWQVEYNPWGYERVRTYSPESQHDLWVVSRKSSYYRVYHFSGKMEKEWKIPKALLGERSPIQVSGDKAGNPIVWTQEGVYRYEHNEWRWTPYADALQLEYWFRDRVANGEQAWTLNKPGQILKIDALTGTWFAIDPPASALERNLQPKSMRRTVQGDILVFMQNGNSGYVYLLSVDDTWKSQEYGVISSENILVQDYFLDEHSALWVLCREEYKFFIQKIDLNGTLLLTQLPSPAESDEWERYDNLIVDSSGRLWVDGGYPGFMAVFRPVWNDTSKEIVRYTTANSEYQDDAPPSLLSDGKIWSFDRRLSTMDTHLADLPSPLPAWFAALDWSLIRLGTMLAQLVVYLVIYLVSTKPTLFQKRTLGAEE